MEQINIFEQASRMSLRFPTTQGNLSTEDLWDMNISALDSLAVSYDEALENVSKKKSFINDSRTSQASIETKLRFDIVKHVLDFKVAERETRRQEKEKAARKQKLLELLNQRDNEADQSMTREQILAELDQL